MPRLLFVEDDPTLRQSVSFIFEREGYAVTGARTGEEALESARAQPPDVVVLDVTLPGIDGFETCRRLRAHPSTAALPVVLVTARSAVDDMVKGFESLADDYVVKPFHPRVLLARIAAVLRRRAGAPGAEPRVEAAGLRVDPDAHEVHVHGRRVELTPTEFALLHLLVAHPNRVFSRASILDRLRGDDADVTERVVDFQVAGLRRKLGDAGRHVETVRGLGYKFAPVPGAES